MSYVVINPSKLSGSLKALPSKSYCHRAIIAAALSGGVCRVSSVVFSEDVLATLRAVKALGAKVEMCGESLVFSGFNSAEKTVVVNCGDCACTLRFLVPLVSALGLSVRFDLSPSLAKRPMMEYLKVLTEFGLSFEQSSDLSLKISGKLRPGKFKIPGDISSQFVSGLLFALPILEGDSEIILTSKLESSGYAEMTTEVLKCFGINIKKTDQGYFISGGQKYKASDYMVEGDWSQAAFFLAGAVLSGNVRVKNLNKNSLQADSEIFRIIRQMGGKIFWDGSDLVAEKSPLKAVSINASETPDLVPILAALLANCEGISKITGAKRLKFKECDRLEAISRQFGALGVKVENIGDGLVIYGSSKNRVFKNSLTLWSHCDHRIAMALSIMALNLQESVKITDAKCVRKSYPNFFRDYNLLGGKASVVNLG